MEDWLIARFGAFGGVAYFLGRIAAWWAIAFLIACLFGTLAHPGPHFPPRP